MHLVRLTETASMRGDSMAMLCELDRVATQI